MELERFVNTKDTDIDTLIQKAEILKLRKANELENNKFYTTLTGVCFNDDFEINYSFKKVQYTKADDNRLYFEIDEERANFMSDKASVRLGYIYDLMSKNMQ
jgi:hypothetical protein